MNYYRKGLIYSPKTQNLLNYVSSILTIDSLLSVISDDPIFSSGISPSLHFASSHVSLDHSLFLPTREYRSVNIHSIIFQGLQTESPSFTGTITVKLSQQQTENNEAFLEH